MLDPRPLGPLIVPIEVAFVPGTVVGGQSSVCTVTLSGTVPADQTVQLSTDHPEVFSNLPASIVVLAGSDHKNLTVNTVTSITTISVTATVTASCNGGQARGALTVN